MINKLQTIFLGKELTSPIIVGAGPGTKNMEDILEAEHYGAGAAIIKSIGWHSETLKSSKDRKRYRWIKGYGTYLKSTYLCEILSKSYGCELIKAVKKSSDMPLYASVFYPSLVDEEDILRWIELANEVAHAGADAIQLDFFYLNLRKLSQDEIDFFIDAVNRICLSTTLPVLPKINIGMDYDLILALGQRSLSSGLIFIDSINTEPYIDIWKNGAPLFDGILYNTQNGASGSVIAGEPLLPFTFNMTQRLYRETAKELSAGGGIEHWEDIVRCIMLGASTTHLTSILMRKGFKYIRELNSSLNYFLDKKGLDRISDLKGVSYTKGINNLVIKNLIINDKKATIDTSKCNDCGLCEKLRVCKSFSVKPYDFNTNCDGCTFCIQFCPKKAISLKEC